MPPPRVLGPSLDLPGAVDVETDYGVLALPEDDPQVQALGGMGASAPIAEGGLSADILSAAGQLNAPAVEGLAPPAAPTQATDAGGPPKIPTEQQRLQESTFADPQAAAAQPAAPPGQAGPRSVREQILGGLATQANAPRGGGGPLTRQTSTLQQQVLGPTTPEQQAALDAYGQAGQEAQQGILDIGYRRAEGAERLRRGEAEQLRQTQADLATQQAEYQARREETLNAIRGRRESIDRRRQAIAQTEIDPDAIWGDENTGRQVLSAIAAGVGAFAAGLTGGRNEAMQVIQTAIDRDIAAQRANLENQRGDLDAQRGMLADLYMEMGDMDQAQAAARELAWAEAEREIRALTAEVGGDLAIEDAEQMAAEMRARQAEAAQEGIEQQVGTMSIETTQRRSSGGGPRRPQIPGLSADQARYIDYAEGIGGGPAEEIDERAVERYGDQRRNLQRAQQAQREMAEAIEEAGGSIPGIGVVESAVPDWALRFSSEPAAKYLRARRDYVQSIIRAESGAQVSQEEMQREQEAMGFTDGLTSEAIEENALRAAQEKLQNLEVNVEGSFPEAVRREFERRSAGARPARGPAGARPVTGIE